MTFFPPDSGRFNSVENKQQGYHMTPHVWLSGELTTQTHVSCVITHKQRITSNHKPQVEHETFETLGQTIDNCYQLSIKSLLIN